MIGTQRVEERRPIANSSVFGPRLLTIPRPADNLLGSKLRTRCCTYPSQQLERVYARLVNGESTGMRNVAYCLTGESGAF